MPSPAGVDAVLRDKAPTALTPCAVVDVAAVRRNIAQVAEHLRPLNVTLRPHLKTCKSVPVARMITGPGRDVPITVSTLAEAEYFFKTGGYTNILYAVGFAAAKVRVVKPLYDAGLRLKVAVDHPDAAAQLARECAACDVAVDVVIEVDSGDSRGGFDAAGEAGRARLLAVAKALSRGGDRTRLVGVMTHGGHSYHGKAAEELRAIAERERVAAVSAADILRGDGHTISIVSAGSTPTVTHFGKVDGLTELRAGVYVFQDLDQLGIGSCPSADNIALTVLASVIGHTTSGRVLIDAGGLALSKDLSAAKHGSKIEAGYGWVAGHDDLHVAAVSQEHGQIDFKRKTTASAQSVEDVPLSQVFPVGSRVRIIPNHACFTAAAYDGYVAVDPDTQTIDVWPRVNGWFNGDAVGNPERLRQVVGPSRL